MPKRIDRAAFLEAIKEYLFRDSTRREPIRSVRRANNLARGSLANSSAEALNDAWMKMTGLNPEKLQRLAEQDKTLAAAREAERVLIEAEVARTAREQHNSRALMAHRRDLLQKLSGHSPDLDCVVMADEIVRRIDRERDRGWHFSEFAYSDRRSSLDNAGDVGGTLRSDDYLPGWTTGMFFILPMLQTLHMIFVWEADRDGILEAQAFLQLNGDWEVDIPWGVRLREAWLAASANFEVIQPTAGPPPWDFRNAAAPRQRLLEEAIPARTMWDPAGGGLMGHLNQECELQTPAMEIERRLPVGFVVSLTLEFLANGGGEASINLAEDLTEEFRREVNCPGVVFRVSE